MKSLMKCVLLGTIAAITFVGCASKELDKKVDEKLAAVDTQQTPAQTKDKATQSIEAIPNLTETQRTQLTELRDATRARMQTIQESSAKIRSLLVDEVFSANYQSKEVNNLKKRLTKLDRERTALTFSAIDKANKILGRTKQKETARATHEYMNEDIF